MELEKGREAAEFWTEGLARNLDNSISSIALIFIRLLPPRFCFLLSLLLWEYPTGVPRFILWTQVVLQYFVKCMIQQLCDSKGGEGGQIFLETS